jgi:FlaA1/EpsC-like NDP-sugar epimerase
MNVNAIIGRERELFSQGIASHEKELSAAIGGARVLVFGGAGSIGKEVAAQIFRRNPAALHVIDVSENNLVELVRDLRSSQGYITGETLFLPLDFGAVETEAFIASQKPYDYVLNIAAMKHVRSEKDAFSLMRMVKTNILDTRKTLRLAIAGKTKKYFAVSTDKAKNPANLMGSTKRIMEDVIFGESEGTDTAVSTARFANVAFSDGSLLHGFRQRLLARQPISAPRDIRRYFVTGPESGMLCLASLVLGAHREIFFPNLDAGLDLLTFSEIAVRFLRANGYEPVEVQSEGEARDKAGDLIAQGKWPCYFFDSDTPGEKPFEEFYSGDDDVTFKRFQDMGVISAPSVDAEVNARYETFLETVEKLRNAGRWTKPELAAAIAGACPDLHHVEGQGSLDGKM